MNHVQGKISGAAFQGAITDNRGIKATLYVKHPDGSFSEAPEGSRHEPPEVRLLNAQAALAEIEVERKRAELELFKRDNGLTAGA